MCRPTRLQRWCNKNAWEMRLMATDTEAPPTVDDLVLQLAEILARIEQNREYVRGYKRTVDGAQRQLAEGEGWVATLEASYAEVRQRLIRAAAAQ